LTDSYNFIINLDKKLIKENIWELCDEILKGHIKSIIFISKLAIFLNHDVIQQKFNDLKCDSFKESLKLLSNTFKSVYKAKAIEFLFENNLN